MVGSVQAFSPIGVTTSVETFKADHVQIGGLRHSGRNCGLSTFDQLSADSYAPNSSTNV
jgi:hypothetical protein